MDWLVCLQLLPSGVLVKGREERGHCTEDNLSEVNFSSKGPSPLVDAAQSKQKTDCHYPLYQPSQSELMPSKSQYLPKIVLLLQRVDTHLPAFEP